MSLPHNPLHDGSPEARKATSLLNKLTLSNFDSISDQIIEIVNMSEYESDARTLVFLARLVVDTAISQPLLAEPYARLYRKLMEEISPRVQNDGIKNAEGKPVAGGILWRRYLLNAIQHIFGQGCPRGTPPDVQEENNRTYLGAVSLMGEIFKLQMLTERVMHQCVRGLLTELESPAEADVQTLCVLLEIVGAILDTPRGCVYMDFCFSRIGEWTSNVSIPMRLRARIQDVVDLRSRKWKPAAQTQWEECIQVSMSARTLTS
ncbi:armadillo-type protein [Mycena vulgaris]|nr:armadillo-type protein [Mycena vulgaris]